MAGKVDQEACLVSAAHKANKTDGKRDRWRAKWTRRLAWCLLTTSTPLTLSTGGRPGVGRPRGQQDRRGA
eukprot:152337-Chlamydomonas_euryale.AAC.1